MRLYLAVLIVGALLLLTIEPSAAFPTCSTAQDCTAAEPYCVAGFCQRYCDEGGEGCCQTNSDCHPSVPYCNNDGWCGECRIGLAAYVNDCDAEGKPCALCGSPDSPTAPGVYSCNRVRPYVWGNFGTKMCADNHRWGCADGCTSWAYDRYCDGTSMYCDKSTHDYVDGSTWNQAWIHGQVCVGSQASGVGDGVFTVDPNKGFQNGNCNNRCAWGDDTCSAGGDVVENSFGCWAGSGICSYQFGQCIVENCGAGETCMDAACVPALCNAGNEGTACSGDSWDTANHYCSTGLADGPGAGNCCPNGEYWDGARCIDSNECYSNPCPYLPGTSNWWASSACVNGGQTCCSISGGKYGISPYYDYQNIVVYS